MAAALIATVALAGSASAATYTPNTTADGSATATDCPPDAAAAAGACSLRDALAAANESTANDEIVLEGRTYELDPTQGTLGIDSGGTLLIRGTSARATVIDGNGGIRPFTVAPDATGSIEDLAVTGGDGSCSDCSGNGNGGGIAVEDTGGDGQHDARLTLTRVRVFGNGTTRTGGGILNNGKLTLDRSLVDGNSAQFAGGGIENNDELTLRNSTVSGNSVEGVRIQLQKSSNGDGGGIKNSGDNSEAAELSGTSPTSQLPSEFPFVRADNSTIANNTAAGNGGGVATELSEGCTTTYLQECPPAGTPEAGAFFHNTIVSDNKANGGTNCYGNQPKDSGDLTSSRGHNLEDGDSCLFTADGDLNKKSGLAALADNGGGTNTQALAADSAAVDAAESDGCPAGDQRGTSRPQGTKCDIGAYERAAPQAPQDEPPAQGNPAPRPPRCLDTLPPITTLNRDGLSVTKDAVTLRGTSTDQAPPCISGVQRVEVSMAKVSGTDLNCRFLRRSTTFLLSPFQNCRQPIRFVADGTGHWTFRFDVRLKPGRYRAQARGYDEERNKETPKKHRNIVVFRVK